MLKVDRPVIGCERRRNHPVDPFEVKRHGVTHFSPQLGRSRARGRQPIMELVNGTFGALAANSPRFGLPTAPFSWVPARILRTISILRHIAVNDD
jgi:hypothetical protein